MGREVNFRECSKLNLLTGRVGIMTNFYHLPRAMRFAVDIFKGVNVTFIPLVARGGYISKSGYICIT